MKTYRIPQGTQVLPLLVAHPMGTSRWDKWDVINQSNEAVQTITDWYFTKNDLMEIIEEGEINLYLYFIKLPHSARWNAFSVNQKDVQEL